MIIKKEDFKEVLAKLGVSKENMMRMEIDDYFYVKGLNKIKRIGEDEWIFLRFDSVNSHIIYSSYTHEDTRKIYQDFRDVMDYTLKYGQERCDAVNSTFDEETATKIVSSNSFIEKQCKTTSSPLTGESGFTKTLEHMADYILYTKFDNMQQEAAHNDLKAEQIRIKAINKRLRKEDENKRLEKLKQELKETPYNKRTKELAAYPEHFKITSIDKIIEEDGGIVGTKHKVNYQRVDRLLYNGEFAEGEDNFWKRIAPKRDIYNLRDKDEEIIRFEDMGKAVIRQYKEEIAQLEAKPFNPERAKVISNLKGEMRTALECFRKIISFNPVSDMHERITEDAWQRFSYRDTETYLALLLGYSELHKKYHNKVNTSMWCVLKDFEAIMDKTPMTPTVYRIQNYILETGDTYHVNINRELENHNLCAIPQHKISYIINEVLPKAFHDTYEAMLEEWIWTYRRKGLYKQCRKCGEIKLAVDDRYYNKEKKGKLGLKSSCKVCLSS